MYKEGVSHHCPPSPRALRITSLATVKTFGPE